MKRFEVSGFRWRFSNTFRKSETSHLKPRTSNLKELFLMNIYYDKDADPKHLAGKRIAVIGYGSQGFAHSNNLKDSGIDAMVGLRKGSKSWEKAAGAGLKVVEVAR